MQRCNAIIADDPVHAAPTQAGPLTGLHFAVKDVMDVAGTTMGMGHPLWASTHSVATKHAECIDRLLAQGAELTGKTQTDELTYSLAGNNSHYGIPPNPAVPDAIPGGSSSGSASAVAQGLVEFAIGTDTGGSIRIPASYCGLYGLRPTHDAVSRAGVGSLAPQFDTVGWLTRRADILMMVGDALLPLTETPVPSQVALLGDGLELVGTEMSEQASRAMHRLGLPVSGTASIGSLERFRRVFQVVQGFEAWATHGDWITTNKPVFGPGVAERFEAASKITASEARAAQADLDSVRQHVRELMGEHTIWCLPTAPAAALPLAAPAAEVDRIRGQTLCLTAVAGVAGLPQLSMPWLHDARGPVGFSLIGPPGSDRHLLRLARDLEFASQRRDAPGPIAAI
jgi:amidase